MSENNSNKPDENLNPNKPVGIQQGEKTKLRGGRRLTKFPMIVIFVIVVIVVILVAVTMYQVSNPDNSNADSGSDSNSNAGGGVSTGVPVDMFGSNDKKTGAVPVGPIKPKSTGKDSCLENVVDPQGNTVLNSDGTPKQQACNPNAPAASDVMTSNQQAVEGSQSDFENKKRLLELDRIRQKNELEMQQAQMLQQQKQRELDNRNQSITEHQNAIANVLNTGSTLNGTGLNSSMNASNGNSGASGLGMIPGSRSMPNDDNGSEPDKYDIANGQSKKQAWASQKRDDDVYLNKSLIDAVSEYEVKAGTVIPGVLITGLNSDLPGQVVAQVSQNIYDTKSGNYLLIPQGTKITGSYNSAVTFGQKRAMVQWERLIYPNGASISINFAGVDQAGYNGFQDKVNNHYLRTFGQAALISMFSAGGQIATNSGNNTSGDTQSNGQTLSQELGRQWSQTGQELINRNMNVAPTITVRPGYRFNVMVSKDVILRPYKK